jgi:hypothetical protein
MRRFFCIEALKKIGGLNTYKAAAVVVGKSPSESVEGIRRAYYEVRSRCIPANDGLLGILFMQYISWRNWVLSLDEERLRSYLARYRQGHGALLGQQLAALILRIRRDPALVEIASICQRTGPLASQLMERDLGSLREDAVRLKRLFADATAAVIAQGS